MSGARRRFLCQAAGSIAPSYCPCWKALRQLDQLDLTDWSSRFEALISLVRLIQLRCESHLGMYKTNEWIKLQSLAGWQAESDSTLRVTNTHVCSADPARAREAVIPSRDPWTLCWVSVVGISQSPPPFCTGREGGRTKAGACGAAPKAWRARERWESQSLNAASSCCKDNRFVALPLLWSTEAS